MKRPATYRVTFADLIACMMMVLLLMAALLPGAAGAREMANRQRCASNLRQIGQAMMMYANNEVRNAQSFPRTQYDPAHADDVRAFTNWMQPHSFGEGAPEANDVTAPFYLLLKTEDLPAEAMHCPDSKARPLVFGNSPEAERRGPDGKPLLQLAKSALDLSNFPGIEYMSYSMQNPYGGKEARDSGFKWNSTLAADFALAADLNPGGEAILKAKPNWSRKQMHDANSPNHGGDGQNVLYGDGHVYWQPTPFVGPIRGLGGHLVNDNIYAPDGATKGVMGPPRHIVDNVLLPAADYKEPEK